MKSFIEDNDFSSRTIALFGTSAGGCGSEIDSMQMMLDKKNVTIKGRFYCRGRFWFGNKDKPSTSDLENAQTFAQHMIH